MSNYGKEFKERLSQLDKEAQKKRLQTDYQYLASSGFMTDMRGNPKNYNSKVLLKALNNTDASTRDLITFLVATGAHDPRDVFRSETGHVPRVRFTITVDVEGRQYVQPIGLRGKYGSYTLASQEFADKPSASFLASFAQQRKEMSENWVTAILGNEKVTLEAATNVSHVYLTMKNLDLIKRLMDTLRKFLEEEWLIVYKFEEPEEGFDGKMKTASLNVEHLIDAFKMIIAGATQGKAESPGWDFLDKHYQLLIDKFTGMISYLDQELSKIQDHRLPYGNGTTIKHAESVYNKLDKFGKLMIERHNDVRDRVIDSYNAAKQQAESIAETREKRAIETIEIMKKRRGARYMDPTNVKNVTTDTYKKTKRDE